MSTQFPQLLTKLIHKWLLNHDFDARIVPGRRFSHPYYGGDVIRLGNDTHIVIVVYSNGVGDCRVKVEYLWPQEPVWLDHRGPGFFGYLEQLLTRSSSGDAIFAKVRHHEVSGI